MSGFNYVLCDEIHQALLKNQKDPCVFISYKSEDIKAAEVINNYLNNTANINTYFDVNDAELKKSIDTANDDAIVSSIKRGLETATHLLCLISDKTHLSWWVPYEIGYADSKELSIASLKLKNIDDIPSFLKTKTVLYSIGDFLEFFSTVNRFGDLFNRYGHEGLSRKGTGVLEPYIEKGE